MKKIFFVLIFSSTSAFACPQLAGVYNCQGSEDSYEMEISQAVDENDVTTYSITVGGEEGTFIADGVARPHTVMVEGTEVNGTLSTSCSDNGAGSQFLGNYQGYDIDYNDGFTLMEDGSLSEEIVTYVDGEVYSTENYTCTRPQ